MKLICDGLDIADAIAKVSKAISAHTMNPILEGIKMQAMGDHLILTATNLELSIEVKINAEVLQEGQTVAPGKYFGDFVRKLTNERIMLTASDENRLSIKYMDSEGTLQCFNADDFPKLTKIEEGEIISLKKKDLKDIISKTIFSVLTEDTRPILKGCLFEIKENTLTAVAIDGYRLAMAKKELLKTTKDMSIIIPATSLSEISKFLSDTDEEINLYLHNNTLMVEVDNVVVITRLLEGEFIKYRNIIPNEFLTSVVIDKKMFDSGLDRASIVSRMLKNNIVSFDIKENLITISSVSDIGKMKENINIKEEGKDLQISFNPRYFQEAIKVVDDEFIKMQFNTNTSPAVITPVEGDDYLFLILPIRLMN